MSSDITWSVDYSGTPNDFDINGAKSAIDKYNEERQTPLPNSTGAEIKASYLILCDEVIDRWHDSNAREAANNFIKDNQIIQRLKLASDADRAAVLAALPSL